MVFSDSQIGYATVILASPAPPVYGDSPIGYTTVTLTSPAPATPKFRVSKVVAQGTGTNPKFRVSKVIVQGAVPLSVPAIPDQSSEAYSSTTISVSGSYPPGTSFTWRQISGPPVTFVDNGTNVTFSAPSTMGGAAVVFGVTAVSGGSSSPEVSGQVNVLPHLYWYADPTSGVWKPVTRTTAA